MGLFDRLLNKNQIPNYSFVRAVNNIDLKNKSNEKLRDMLGSSELKDELLFAIIKEVIFRLKGIVLFDTQIAAAYSMLNGKIIELLTGEGKTFAAVIAAICFCKRGKSVHILVFNDYLAKRDYTDNLPIFKFCGISLGCVEEISSKEDRKAAYQSEVVYASAKEAGFDYLRDFLRTDSDDLLFMDHDVAIVDEADSILIDEARVPLVLAGDLPMAKNEDVSISHAVSQLHEDEVSVQKADNKVWLTDRGISRLEGILDINNLYDGKNENTLSLVNDALKAHYLLRRDKEYIVKENNVLVVDEATGRVAVNRRFPDGLHNAVEIKEQIAVGSQTMIYNSITIQSFLKRYKTLCGMTGTVRTSQKEIFNMYELEVDVIPPHLPCIRVDHNDVVFNTNEEKERAVMQEILRAHEKCQPVLLGTASVEESELYSKLLTDKGIEHSVLNARNEEEEARIIAEAGQLSSVTVSTNMAGRGVDIKLGGVNEKDKELVMESGGLYVISTIINPSLRTDNQLRGRSGRRGDKGESKFFVSLEDPLVCAYFKENDIDDEQVQQVLKEDANKSVAELIRKVQRLEEGRNAESRYMLEKYSFILEEQRKIMSKYRTGILKKERRMYILQEKDSELYNKLLQEHSEEAIDKAQRQLALYFINLCWAQYLASMEDARNGIHLMVVGGKSPIFEYNRLAIEYFDEMMNDIDNSVLKYMKICKITEEGIDMKGEGLTGASTTWTYVLDDSTSQFSRIPHLIKTISKAVKGQASTIKGLLSKDNKNTDEQRQ